jgi:uncharacterized membrane protein YczE
LACPPRVRSANCRVPTDGIQIAVIGAFAGPACDTGAARQSLGYHPPVHDRWFSREALRRIPKLMVGLLLFGIGIALMADAGLGLGPWEAFHQGISRHTGLELGTVSILLGVPILLMWLPLRERPGIGTLLNIVFIGLATNIALAVLPAPIAVTGASSPAWLFVVQSVLMVGGVATIGVASGIYLAADLGAGPRDGLMTGLHHRFGLSIAQARTAVELIVLAVGFLLGGTIGLGTLVFAFGIGPIVHWALGIFDPTGVVIRRRRGVMSEAAPAGPVDAQTPASEGAVAVGILESPAE